MSRSDEAAARGLLDGIPLPTHYFLKTNTSQIESSEPYDPFWSLFFSGHIRWPYPQRHGERAPGLLAARALRIACQPLPNCSPPATPFTGVFYYHLLRRKPIARLQWVFNNHYCDRAVDAGGTFQFSA
jgi:hypothetical protein